MNLNFKTSKKLVMRADYIYRHGVGTNIIILKSRETTCGTYTREKHDELRSNALKSGGQVMCMKLDEDDKLIVSSLTWATPQKPLYTHDCDGCTYLGQYDASAEKGWGMVDLYVCNTTLSGLTVIARYGDDCPEYGSGLTFARTSAKYAEALRRALHRGLLNARPSNRAKAEKILAEFDNQENT